MRSREAPVVLPARAPLPLHRAEEGRQVHREPPMPREAARARVPHRRGPSLDGDAGDVEAARPRREPRLSFYLHGILKGGRRPSTIEEIRRRFWSKVRKVDGGCWTWITRSRRGDRPSFKIGQVTFTAARVAWALTRGALPIDLCALHRCDNPECVRPSHLFAGTVDDNNADREAKGRTSQVPRNRGVDNPSAKLWPIEVAVIRVLGATNKQQPIARAFGVSRQTVGEIINGKRWRSAA